ncbi:MAG: sulfotransferase family protein [Rubrobacter sp.]
MIVRDGDEAARPFAYFVIQKVACTSIKSALAPLFGIPSRAATRERAGGEGPRFPIHRIFDRSGCQLSLSDFVRRAEAGDFRRHFAFAFVRNPYDRLVSCWSDKIAGGGEGLSDRDKELGLVRGLTFSWFVRVVSEIPDEEANPHYRSQHLAICRADGTVVPEFLGSFENLAADFVHVCNEIGAPRLSLPHRLRSRGASKNYRDFYDGATRRIVERRFARDLELLGYRF